MTHTDTTAIATAARILPYLKYLRENYSFELHDNVKFIGEIRFAGGTWLTRTRPDEKWETTNRAKIIEILIEHAGYVDLEDESKVSEKNWLAKICGE